MIFLGQMTGYFFLFFFSQTSTNLNGSIWTWDLSTRLVILTSKKRPFH